MLTSVSYSEIWVLTEHEQHASDDSCLLMQHISIQET